MSRRILAALLILAAGCKSAPAPENQMAPTPPLQAKPQEVADKKAPDAGNKTAPVPPAAPASSDGIAGRVNNEIITWKDVRDVLKEIKPADPTPELKKSKLREM